jgi:hypothetical protein
MTMCSAFEKKRVSAGTQCMGMVKCEMPGQQQAYSIPAGGVYVCALVFDIVCAGLRLSTLWTWWQLCSRPFMFQLILKHPRNMAAKCCRGSKVLQM